MREIKFRAFYKPLRVMVEPKNLESINFEVKVVGVYIPIEKKGFHKFRMSDFELMQFTGQKDVEGREIFECDNLFAKGNFENSEYEYVGTVKWDDDDSKFKVYKLHGTFEYIPSGCVVMGNQYEGYVNLVEGEAK